MNYAKPFGSGLLILGIAVGAWKLTQSTPVHNPDPFKVAIQEIKRTPSWDVESVQDSIPYFLHSELNLTWMRTHPDIIQIPQFEFTSHRNQKINETHMMGSNSVVAFIYTTCGDVCPVLVKNISKIKFHQGTQFYLISVNPDYDSPKVLKEYARRMNLSKRDNIHLLTGPRDEVIKIAREVFKADAQARERFEKTAFLHSENTYVLDHEGKLRGIFNPNNPVARRKIERMLSELARDIPKLAHRTDSFK